VPQRSTTVRFDDDLWDLLTREAAAGGVSTAQFVRDAAVLRLGFLAERRGDERARATLGLTAGRRRPGQPPAAVTDERRLAALRRTGLLDSAPEPGFDRLTRLASRLLDAPVSLVSLVDRDRQFFKSCVGLPAPWSDRRETLLSHSVCQHVVASRRPLVVGDLREHPELRDSLAVPDLGVIAYLGIPLVTSEGAALGSLCVIDHRPRDWSEDDVAVVRELAAVVVEAIEERERVES
jgi:GAF domain-containing protein